MTRDNKDGQYSRESASNTGKRYFRVFELYTQVQFWTETYTDQPQH